MGAREAAAQALERSGMGALLRRVPGWRGALVVCHHRVGDPERTRLDPVGFGVSAAGLAEQVALLGRHFELVRAEQLPALARSGRGRYAALTFDDGYRDNHEVALPLLRDLGAPATFFLATGFLDRPSVAWWDEIAWAVRESDRAALDLRPWLPEPLRLEGEGAREAAAAAITARYKALPARLGAALLDALGAAAGTGRAPAELARAEWMTWEMARELRAAGMSLGGHTVTHPVLARLPAAQQRREIAGSLARIAAETGERPRTFSYPVGTRDAFDGTTRAALAAEGVTCAVSYYGGWCSFRRWDALDVPRAWIDRGTTPERLRAIAALPALFAPAA